MECIRNQTCKSDIKKKKRVSKQWESKQTLKTNFDMDKTSSATEETDLITP